MVEHFPSWRSKTTLLGLTLGSGVMLWVFLWSFWEPFAKPASSFQVAVIAFASEEPMPETPPTQQDAANVKPPVPIQNDWPQFLGPHRDGTVQNGPALRTALPAKGLTPNWTKAVGAGYAGPVVSDGKLILFHQLAGREVVTCLDSQTGKELWQAEYPSQFDGAMLGEKGPRASPAIFEQKVVTFGAENTLSCFDLRTGAVQWQRRLATEWAIPNSFFGPASSPLIVDGLVYVQLGASNKNPDQAAGMCAINLATGATAWTAMADTASYASPSYATLAGKPTLLVFARTGLHLLEPRTGTEYAFHRWRARSDISVNAASPVVAHEQILLSACYGTGSTLLAFDGQKLNTIWTKPESELANHFNTAVVAGDYFYAIDGRQEQTPDLVCCRWRDGQEQWRQSGFGCAALILNEQEPTAQILALTERGRFVLLEANPQKYQEYWQSDLCGPSSWAHPALVAGHLFVRDQRQLYCYKLTN